jgi:hypothetical protein
MHDLTHSFDQIRMLHCKVASLAHIISRRTGDVANAQPERRFVLAGWGLGFVSCFGIPVSCFSAWVRLAGS